MTGSFSNQYTILVISDNAYFVNPSKKIHTDLEFMFFIVIRIYKFRKYHKRRTCEREMQQDEGGDL